MPWIEALLRGQKVFVRADATGQPAAEGGRVEVRYRREDGRAYRAGVANLNIVGPLWPDSHCQDAAFVAAAATTTPGAARTAPSGSASTPRAGKPTASAPAPSNARFDVYTDGACSGNPGPAGSGFLIIDHQNGDRLVEGYEYLGQATNNVAELTAVLRGVEAIADRQAAARVHTDSSYAIGVLQKGWKAKANTELIEIIRRELATRPNVRLQYVPGHAGVRYNEQADLLARTAVETRASRALPVVGAPAAETPGPTSEPASSPAASPASPSVRSEVRSKKAPDEG